MAEAATSTVEGRGATAAQPALATAHALEHFSGRGVSWVGVTITIIGFVIGGVAFVPRPIWWLLWVGVGVAAVGGIVLMAAKTFTEDWY